MEDRTAILIISAVIILGFGGVVIALLAYPPKADNQVVNVLIGSLATGYALVLNYWFRRGP